MSTVDNSYFSVNVLVENTVLKYNCEVGYLLFLIISIL